MALARTEGAMEIAGGAAPPFDRALDEAEGFFEGSDQLRRHDVVSDGGRGRLVADALGQLQDEIIGLDPLRNMDQVAQQRRKIAHDAAFRPPARRRTGAGGIQSKRSASVRPSSRASSATKPAK